MRLLIKVIDIIPERIVEISRPAANMIIDKQVTITDIETYNKIKCVVDYYKESNTCNNKNMYNSFIRLLPALNGFLGEFNLAIMQASITNHDDSVLTPVLLDLR